MTKLIELFTDGSCKGNPGPGGWGVLLRYGKHEKKLYGGEAMTTNNRMELLAAIEGLAALKHSCKVRLTTDSQYVRQGMMHWVANWQRKGWKTANGKEVKNQDLWKHLYELTQQHDVEWCWVKGHSGHNENEIADQLACLGAEESIARAANNRK